jgi:hypothetical protein
MNMLNKFPGIYHLIIMIAMIGWSLNIYKLVYSNLEVKELDSYSMVRLTGLYIPPVGAIVGYFTFDEELETLELKKELNSTN